MFGLLFWLGVLLLKTLYPLPIPRKKTELFAVQPCAIHKEPDADDWFAEETICTNKKSTVDELLLLMIKELEKL